MKKKQNSFIKTCVFYLSIYSIILILTFLFINTIIERSIKNIYFDIDSIKEYKTYLKNDQYNNIPIQKYLRNDIVVFNAKENDEQEPIVSTYVLEGNIYVGIDLNSGFFQVECEDIDKMRAVWDDLFLARGLSEKDIDNYVIAAQYILLQKK